MSTPTNPTPQPQPAPPQSVTLQVQSARHVIPKKEPSNG